MYVSELYIKKPNCYTFYYNIYFVNLNIMNFQWSLYGMLISTYANTFKKCVGA